MILNYKYEIFPTEYQIEKMSYWIDICRVQYNSAILDKTNTYKNTGTSISRYDLQKIQTQDKKKHNFLKDLPSQPLQEVFHRVEKAFQNFFRGDNSYPKIKNYKDYNSITFSQFGYGFQRQNGRRNFVKRACRMVNKQLHISKLGLIDINLHRPLDGKVKQAVIKRQSGKWFAIFSVERHAIPKPTTDNIVGLDVGIDKFLVDSNGNKIDNPRHLRKTERKLKRSQRKLSKKKRGSSNYKKQIARLQKLHTKVSNQRNDFLHKTSYNLSVNNDVVVIEDLDIRSMVKNNRLAKSISDAGWGKFGLMLTYKLERTGGALLKVCPSYTSQDCSVCGHRVPKTLAIRVHDCDDCGIVLDRDHNAAINIKKAGLLKLAA